jgi:hypothetical protein
VDGGLERQDLRAVALRGRPAECPISQLEFLTD